MQHFQFTAYHAFIIVLLIISSWLISSVYLVNVEYSDGYATIANTKSLLGQIPSNLYSNHFPDYQIERMPLNSILLIPTELFTNYLQLPAFEVRLHHLLFIFIHISYLWIAYTLLRQKYIDYEIAALIAFLSTIPNFIFSSYAPFISVDIYPGIIFLYMMIAVLVFDLARSIIEGNIIYNDFFTNNPIVNFLRVIDATSNYKRPILMPHTLSFTSQTYSPLAGDRLHRIFQIHPSFILRFYNNANITYIETNKHAMQQIKTLPENSVLLLTSGFLYRMLGTKEHYFSNDSSQLAAFSQRVLYKRNGNELVHNNNETGIFMIIQYDKVTNQPSLVALNNKISFESAKKFGFAFRDQLEVAGFRVTALSLS